MTGAQAPGRVAAQPSARLSGRLLLGAALGGGVAAPGLVLLLLVESRYEALERLDLGVAGALHRWALVHPSVVTLLEVGQYVLSPNVFRLAVLVVAFALWRAGSRRLCVWSVVSTASGALLGVVVKQVVHRARPSFPDPVAVAGSYSFPSGHALGSALGVGVLLVVGLPVLHRTGKAFAWTVGVLLVLLTGFDRLALGVHYVSDVLAGWFTAGAVLVGTATAFGAWRGRQPSRGLDPAGSRRLARSFDATLSDR